MKLRTRWLLVALLCMCFGKFAAAGDYTSVIFTSTLPEIVVPEGRFLQIRNFTQEGGSGDRGVVQVTKNQGMMANVLAAAMIDPTSTTLEPVNSVVIAGHANVTATCPAGATCFITYKKDPD